MLRLLPFDGAVLHQFADDPPDVRRRARLVTAFGIFAFVGGTTLGLSHYLLFEVPFAVTLPPIVAGFASLVAPLLLLRSRSLRLGAHAIATCWFVATGWGVVTRGGLASPPMMTLASVPFIAMAIAGSRAGISWIAACAAEIATLTILRENGVILRDEVPAQFASVSNVLTAVLFGALLLAMAVAQEWLRVKAHEELADAERRKGEAEREAQILRADRLASLGQLAASLAHEINNPLSYVLANLDYLESFVQEDDQRCALRDAIDGAARVKVIVHDLKTFARGDDETLGPVDLRTVVASSVRMVMGEVKQRAALHTEIFACPPVVASETRVGQILVNLLVNASQAIPDDGARDHAIRVTLDTDATGGARLSVRDSGRGIPKDLLPRVTEPFFTTKPVGVGTGLGLSVCDDLVRRFGGTMSITSAVGVGTEVTIVFPPATSMLESAKFAVVRPRRSEVA